MKRLSKSRYTTFCQCPKALWLKVNKPELIPEGPALQACFEAGNEVGDLAMGLFGDYVDVTSPKEDGSLDLNKMIELTKQHMEQGTENICEAYDRNTAFNTLKYIVSLGFQISKSHEDF